MSAPFRDAAFADVTDSDFEPLIAALEIASGRNLRIARWIFVVGGIAAVAGLGGLTYLTAQTGQSLERSSGNIMLAAFDISRSAALAATVAGILVGTLNLGRAALDQATRYEKRLMAAQFMHYAFREFRVELAGGTVKFSEVVASIDAWSRMVESAYTKVKFGNTSQPFELDIDSDHVALKVGGQTMNVRRKSSTAAEKQTDSLSALPN